MNRDQFEGKWDQLKEQIKEKWGKITSDDLTVIHGKEDQLLGKLRERYGYTVDQAEKEFNTFIKACKCTSDSESKNKSRPAM